MIKTPIEVEIGNKRGRGTFPQNFVVCDRTSVLGNVFYLNCVEDNHARDAVCDAYETFFNGVVSPLWNKRTDFVRDWACKVAKMYSVPIAGKKELDKLTRSSMLQELDRLVLKAMEGNLILMCWCEPKRCHTWTIKKYLETTCNAQTVVLE